MIIERRVYGYCRVSKLSGEDALSLEAQEARIRAFAIAKGLELTEVLIEAGRSGRTLKRPVLDRLRTEVRNGLVQTVIVLKVDRISRSTRGLLDLLQEFEAAGTSFCSVYESIDMSTAMSKFIVSLLGSLAELEANQCGERTAFCLRQARKDGKVYSGVAPFGWTRAGGNLLPNDAEQQALTILRDMRANGEPWRVLVDWLTASGIQPRGCGRWYPASVRRVLRSKMALEAA